MASFAPRKSAKSAFLKNNPQLSSSDFDKGGVFSKEQRALQSDTRGTVTVEYTVLLVVVVISAAVAIVAMGLPLVQRYQLMKLLIALPVP